MGRHTSAEIAAVNKDPLKEIAETTTWEDVPGTTTESCGKLQGLIPIFQGMGKIDSSNKESLDDAFERHVIYR